MVLDATVERVGKRVVVAPALGEIDDFVEELRAAVELSQVPAHVVRARNARPQRGGRMQGLEDPRESDELRFDGQSVGCCGAWLDVLEHLVDAGNRGGLEDARRRIA